VLKLKGITIAVSAYNEEGNIKKVVESALEVLKSVTKNYEMLVIDDGSTDNMPAILKKLEKKYKKLRVVTHPKNLGIGWANYHCYMNAKYDVIFWNAADNQIKMKEMKKMLLWVNKYDVIIGRRRNRDDPFFRKLNSKLYNLALFFFFGLWTHDIDSAKIYKRKVFSIVKPKSRSAFIETELVVRSKRKGFKIKEVEIEHFPRVIGKATGNDLILVYKQLRDLFKFWLKLR